MGVKTDNEKKMSQEEPDPIPCLWGKGFRWRVLTWRMLSYHKGCVQEALGSRRMTRIFLLQGWVSKAARASASAPRTPCATRGRADALAPPLPGWASPHRCVFPAGSLSVGFCRQSFPLHLSACAEQPANRRVQTCAVTESRKSSTGYTQAGAGADAIHASLITYKFE